MLGMLNTMVRRGRRAAIGLALGALLGLSGCVNLDPSSDPTRFYVLAEPKAAPQGDGPVHLAVRSVDLPEYLYSSQIVVRESEHEILYQPLHRWSGSLDAMIAGALAESLSRARPDLNVSDDSVGRVPSVLSISMLRFEGLPDGEVEVSFDWRLSSDEAAVESAGGRIIQRGSWSPNDVGSLVEELSRLLDQAAQQLGDALPVEPVAAP